VKVRYQSLCPRARWLKCPVSSGAYRPWLLEQGSLTRRLQAASKRFAVQALMQRRLKPAHDEAYLLGLVPHQQDLLREVMLMDEKTPLVFAHSVLPEKSLRGGWQGLGRLGNKPLGAALFANPGVVRAPLQFKKLGRQHSLYRQATKYLPDLPSALWARRSIFQLSKARAIMVTEVFLPAVLDLSVGAYK